MIYRCTIRALVMSLQGSPFVMGFHHHHIAHFFSSSTSFLNTYYQIEPRIIYQYCAPHNVFGSTPLSLS